MRPIDADALLGDVIAAEEYNGMGAIVAGTLKRYIMRQPTLTPPNEQITAAQTCALVEELKKRDGVEVHIAEPHEDLTVSINGPAVILVVTD